MTIASSEFGILGIPGPVREHRSRRLDTPDVDCERRIPHLDMQDADCERRIPYLDIQDADCDPIIRLLSVNIVEGRGRWEAWRVTEVPLALEALGGSG